MSIFFIRYTSRTLLYKIVIFGSFLFATSVITYGPALTAVVVKSKPPSASELFSDEELPEVDAGTPLVEGVENIELSFDTDGDEDLHTDVEEKKVKVKKKTANDDGVRTVPFYSQFSDISLPEWKKVGCGIASLAMLIDYYEPKVSVDTLLEEGIAADAYLSDAGWTHSGLISLSKKHGLTGSSHDMAGSSMDSAFATLESVLKEGPVMVSVHYTFDPKNPIPHLVVINGVSDGKVFYNDPAEKKGGGSISIAKFQSAWKKRYIQIRPIT